LSIGCGDGDLDFAVLECLSGYLSVGQHLFADPSSRELLNLNFGSAPESERSVGEVVKVFPMPVLGVVLLAEAVALMTLARDVVQDRRSAWLVGLVAAAVVGLPYGYVVGLVGGTALSHALRRGWAAQP
jgi:hypothetical protein